MAATELRDSFRRYEADINTGIGVRRFLVDATPDQARNDPGIPALGTTFTFGSSTLIARRMDADLAPGQVSKSIVTVTYDNDGSTSFGAPPDLLPLFHTYELSYQNDELEVPSFRGHWVFVAPEALGESSVRVRWVRDDRVIDIGYTVFIARLNLSSWGISESAAVKRQVGRIHEFGGEYWKFKGAVATLETPTRWQVQYEWFSDPGNGVIDPDAVLSIAGQNRILPTEERPPFHTYLITEFPIDESGLSARDVKPRIRIEPPTGIDANGHLTLPGNPIR